MTLHTEIVAVPRVKDRIKVEIVNGYSELCWVAYRENGWGGWDRIPAMSRAECRRFPKAVGFAAQAVLAAYKQRNNS
jgi:hypothetical protein